MKRTTLILLLILGLVLAGGLGLALRSFVGSYILLPILFVAWLARLVINSVPGWAWWAWFVIIAVVVVWRSLRVRLRDTADPVESPPVAVGPVHAWAERLRGAHSRNAYFRWILARDLAGISTELAALNALNAPPEIAAYLRVGLAAPPWGPAKPLEKITRLWRPVQETTPLDLDPQVAVAFLEGQMEKKHDN